MDIPDNEEVSHTLQVIGDHIVQNRGDSFDIGESPSIREPQIIEIIQNPEKLANMFGLTKEQVQNVRAAITGAGAGAASKFLSQYFGEEIAGAFGGFVGGMLSKKVFKDK